jgi:NMD protein affecting ribosome stability and mRNA decay
MFYYGNGMIEQEPDEPVEGICPDCANQSRSLLMVYKLHVCMECGKLYILGAYFDDLTDNGSFDNLLESRGIKPGMSTNVLTQN